MWKYIIIYNITLLNESVFFLSLLFWIFILWWWWCSSLTLKRPYLGSYFKFLFTFIFVLLFISFYLIIFIFGCAGASLLQGLFSSCGNRRLFSSCGAWASHCGGFSRAHRGSRAQAQWLWHTGLAPPRHVGSFLIRDRSHVSCFGRHILYHWATMEALILLLF